MENNNICPICGAPLRDAYALQDGDICRNCADDLRFRYPLIYLPRVGMLEDHPQCRGLKKKELTWLKRNREETAVPGHSRAKIYRFDPMQLLTLAEFSQQLRSADGDENRIRADYREYTNILKVDYARALCRTVGKKGVQNIRKRRSGFCVTGFILAGRFQEGDLVTILREDRQWYAEMMALDYEELAVDPELGELRTGSAEHLGDLGNQGHSIRAGYQVIVVLNEKADGIQSGDLIVSD